MGRLILLCLLAMSCAAEVTTGRFQNRACWTLDSPRLRVSILQSGGHVGEIVLKGEREVNPLWIQKRPTIDAEQYNPAMHEKLYGGAAGARLMSGLMGHNVCFPFWGNPSPSEAAAGMTFHGETGITRWRQVSSGADTLSISAELPESRTRFTRTVRIQGPVAWFEETAANDTAWDRPVGWCEHVTLGPPFLEPGVTVMDASLTRGRVNGDKSAKEFTWPAGVAESSIDLRTVRKVDRPSGFVNNFMVDPSRQWGYFTAFHRGHRLLFGYVFRRADFPWLNIWEANNPQMLTRGMEFSNTPVHGTLKALVEEPKLFGVPAYEWLDARARLVKRYAAFSLRVPAEFRGVADVQVEGEQVRIVEKETGKVITLQ
jgi:hypothetical protein